MITDIKPGTTDLKHCSHSGLKGHLVPRDQMTWIYTKAGKRAICDECNARRRRGTQKPPL